MWNNINYDGVLILPKTKEVLEYLKRFSKLKIQGKQWEVQARNMFLDGIIEIAIKEDFTNATEYAKREEDPQPVIFTEDPYIEGPAEVDCFESYTYEVLNLDAGIQGTWTVSDTKLAKVISTEDNTVTIGIISRKSGKFNLIFDYEAPTGPISLSISIRSI